MLESGFKDTIDAHKKRIHIQRITIILLALSTLVLSITLLTRREHVRTIVVPMHAKEPFWIDDDNVSKSYLSDMAAYVMEQYLTVTVETLDAHRETLLKLAAPEVEGELTHTLMLDAKKIKREHISSAFYAKSMKADTDKLEVVVSGTLSRFTVQHRLPNRRVKYRVSFKLNHGRLWLVSIEQVDEDKGSEL